jgi:hypothetical protein
LIIFYKDESASNMNEYLEGLIINNILYILIAVIIQNSFVLYIESYIFKNQTLALFVNFIYYVVMVGLWMRPLAIDEKKLAED